ncbi:mannose-P-dolichol utilization defect 1b isoform X1 [Syngnathoides biaculeatus]|uniref:mannose-P-dolichol utilization defect 1b isoform X1 n=1 Tax=Syngnathoides biaculeatus TaxID=300417 RepID=UPI002ADD80CE|nr:mannose-P-dolichol utilization defect 1b isoform X1 [Syngnathoides biaculeatus]
MFKDFAQQRPGDCHHPGISDGEAASDPEDDGRKERRGTELPVGAPRAARHHGDRGLQRHQQVPLQRVGRGGLPHAADGHHRLPNSALRRPKRQRFPVSAVLLGGAARRAVPGHPDARGDRLAGCQRARHRRQQADSSCHELSQRTHGPIVGHFGLLVVRRLARTHLHLAAGDGRRAAGLHLRHIVGVQRRPGAAGPLLLEQLGRAQEEEEEEEERVGEEGRLLHCKVFGKLDERRSKKKEKLGSDFLWLFSSPRVFRRGGRFLEVAQAELGPPRTSPSLLIACVSARLGVRTLCAHLDNSVQIRAAVVCVERANVQVLNAKEELCVFRS